MPASECIRLRSQARRQHSCLRCVLQGPWVDFVEMVVLLLAGNASFMAGCVYLPLNIGRLMLMAIKKASAIMTQVGHCGCWSVQCLLAVYACGYDLNHPGASYAQQQQ